MRPGLKSHQPGRTCVFPPLSPIFPLHFPYISPIDKFPATVRDSSRQFATDRRQWQSRLQFARVRFSALLFASVRISSPLLFLLPLTALFALIAHSPITVRPTRDRRESPSFAEFRSRGAMSVRVAFGRVSPLSRASWGRFGSILGAVGPCQEQFGYISLYICCTSATFCPLWAESPRVGHLVCSRYSFCPTLR